METFILDTPICNDCCILKEWKDVAFVWNEADYGDVRSLRVPALHVWIPDIHVYNRLVVGLLLITCCIGQTSHPYKLSQI